VPTAVDGRRRFTRAVSRLNPVIRVKLDDLINRNRMFLVGDANGADKAVQQYLRSRGRRNVVVYCMDHCRNNLGAWPMRQISRAGAPRDFATPPIPEGGH